MAGLVDTNVIVYRFDPRFPDKQRIATELLRAGVAEGSLWLPHQAIVEFVAVVTRPLAGGEPLLAAIDALREAEELLAEFEVLYPDEELVRIALRGAAAYQLSWFDAHLWAYAERFGASELLSEDFQAGRHMARWRSSTHSWLPDSVTGRLLLDQVRGEGARDPGARRNREHRPTDVPREPRGGGRAARETLQRNELPSRVALVGE